MVQRKRFSNLGSDISVCIDIEFGFGIGIESFTIQNFDNVDYRWCISDMNGEKRGEKKGNIE